MKWMVIFTICMGVKFTWSRHTHDEDDYMGRPDKIKCIQIAEELVKEAYLKIRQLNDIRDEHSEMVAFDIGLVLGNIRERYRLMVEMYREYRDKYTKRSLFFPPAFRKQFTSIYYVNAMEHIHTLEVEIDKLVHVLESIEEEDINPDPRYDPLPKRIRGLRSNDIKNIARMAEEQEVKSRQREKHLMMKLGLPSKMHTTGKRFQRQWPVERNWELGAYGDMGVYS